MDTSNRLLLQFSGFLNTSPVFSEQKVFKLFPFLKSKNIQITTVLPYLPKNLVLGKRVEIFFKSFIENHNDYKTLKANLQIIEEKITIGELDFLLQETHNNQYIHVELVYKFYLYNPEIDEEIHRWIGPNRRDTLFHKIKKLNEKQLPLLYNDTTEKVLKELQLVAKNFQQQVCFLGQLFVPFALYGNKFPEINNQCIVGYWLRLKAFKENHQKEDTYYIPEKEDWLIDPANNEVWFSFETVFAKIEQSLSQNKSPLCWQKTADNTFEKLFVVWWH